MEKKNKQRAKPCCSWRSTKENNRWGIKETKKVKTSASARLSLPLFWHACTRHRQACRKQQQCTEALQHTAHRTPALSKH